MNTLTKLLPGEKDRQEMTQLYKFLLPFLTLSFLGTTILFSAPAAFAEDNIQGSEQEESSVDIKKQAEEIRQQILKQGPRFAVQGKLEPKGGSFYAVNNITFQVDKKTRIHGKLRKGTYVSVVGRGSGDSRVAKIVNVGDPRKKPKPLKKGQAIGDFPPMKGGPSDTVTK